jgi:hypothetical protein
MAAGFRDMIVAYYEAERRAAGKVHYQIFAEKMHPNPDMRAATRFMFPDAAEILLVRDPRDTLCSYKDFWGTDLQEGIGLVEHHLREMAQINRSALALVVRYEDLVGTETATMDAIWNLLGIRPCELPPATVDAKHQSSGSTADSIGRWKRDLGPEELEAVKSWTPLLNEFGYE